MQTIIPVRTITTAGLNAGHTLVQRTGTQSIESYRHAAVTFARTYVAQRAQRRGWTVAQQIEARRRARGGFIDGAKNDIATRWNLRYDLGIPHHL